MRAFVTGCAGFIGSQLTEALLKEGHSVCGVDCFNDNYGRPQKLQNLNDAREWEAFDFVPIDLARGDLAALVSESDVIFHLAAEPGVRASWGARFDSYLRNNVLATQHLLEAAKIAPGRRFVYASSSSIYGDAEAFPTREDATPRPLSPYGTTKLAAEHLCQLYWANYGVRTVCLRYFSVYGPRQRPDMAFNIFCRAALEGTPITIYGDGRQTRDFTFVGDVVRATMLAGEAPDADGQIYNIGGGSRVTLVEALDMIEELSGRGLDRRHVNEQEGDVRNTSADTSRAEAGLGFRPQTQLAAGLAAEFEWTLQSAEGRLAKP